LEKYEKGTKNKKTRQIFEKKGKKRNIVEGIY
jgi:hypothetical protein